MIKFTKFPGIVGSKPYFTAMIKTLKNVPVTRDCTNGHIKLEMEDNSEAFHVFPTSDILTVGMDKHYIKCNRNIHNQDVFLWMVSQPGASPWGYRVTDIKTGPPFPDR